MNECYKNINDDVEFYQDLVYATCNTLDKILGGEPTTAGTADAGPGTLRKRLEELELGYWYRY